LPGKYEVSASAASFVARIQKEATLNIGAKQLLNFNMQVGQVQESIELTDKGPQGAVWTFGAFRSSIRVLQITPRELLQLWIFLFLSTCVLRLAKQSAVNLGAEKCRLLRV